MTYELPRICRSTVLSAFLVPTSLLAQDMMQSMSGTIGDLPIRAIQGVPSVPYVTNPYGGMFGSMGNIYSPYYRRFHRPGLGGPLADVTNVPGIHYNANPYAGMYGSMGNVYSPYYRQFHQPGVSGMADALSPSPIQGQSIRYHYPYFLPPTTGIR